MEPLLRFLKPASRALDHETERDRYRGALLGLAVGNALGVPVEGFSALDVSSVPPEQLSEIRPEEARGPWDDDVAQAIELAECLLEGPLDADAYMARLLRWMEESGKGMGIQT